MTTVIVLLGLLLIGLVLFVSVSPATLAQLIRTVIPVLLMAVGGLLIFLKQAAIGSLLFFGGLAWFRRSRGVGRLGSRGSSGQKQKSSVRSCGLGRVLRPNWRNCCGLWPVLLPAVRLRWNPITAAKPAFCWSS